MLTKYAHPTTTPKKRNRDPLGERVHEQTYAKTSQLKQCYLNSRCRDGSVSTQVNVNIRNQFGRALQRIDDAELRVQVINAQQNRYQFEDEFLAGEQKLPPGFAVFRRHAIYFIYSIILKRPIQDDWVLLGTIKEIANRLQIPENQYTQVKEISKIRWKSPGF